MAFNKTILIQRSDFDNYFTITNFFTDVDENKLNQLIFLNQGTNVKALICEDLYNELIAQEAANSLTYDNITLIDDYIAPYLVFEVAKEYVPIADINSTRQGLINNTTDYATKAPQNERKDLREHCIRYADFYKRELVRFLNNNKSTYPNYNCGNCSSDLMENNYSISKVQTSKNRQRVKKVRRRNDGMY